MEALSGAVGWLVAAWALAGALVLACVVARDAAARGQPAPLWFLCALLLPVFGALAYLVQRPMRVSSTAPADFTAGAQDAPLAAPDPTLADEHPLVTPLRPASREPSALAAAPTLAHPAASAAEWRRGVGVLPEPLPMPAPATGARADAEPGPPVAWLVFGTLVLLLATGALYVALGGSLPRPTLPGAPAVAPVVPTAAPAAPPTALPVAPALPAPTPEPEAAPPEPTWYTVAEGDTLGEIALRFSTTIDALLQANGLDDADRVVVGQRLLVRP